MQILDHGYLEFIESWGSDVRIVEAARMSTDKGFLGWGTADKPGDEKLLAYLWNNHHTSPFEQAGLTIEVQAPIMVFREWHRHRTQCISAFTPLIFNRPNDGKAYPRPIGDVCRLWHNPANRWQIKRMRLRGDAGDVRVTDAWFSGEKNLYEVKTKRGAAIVSSDHIFKTPDGPGRICDGLTYVMGLANVGNERPSLDWPEFADQELLAEEWRQIDEFYDVSNLGRVRSWLTTRGRRNTPRIKQQIISNSGRAVVSIHNNPAQVSKLVARAFLGSSNLQVLHRNDDPLNNRAINLYYGTAQQNADDQVANGGRRYLHEIPLKVESITAKGCGDTYDISVTGDHWFSAGNLFLHNSYNEMSGRYTQMPDLHYLPSLERIKGPSKHNKQGSDAEVPLEIKLEFLARLKAEQAYIYENYEWALAHGIAKELARIDTPISRYSKMRASGNLWNWLHFLQLRQAPAAQFEIRVYADAMANIMTEHFPRVMELFKGAV